MRTSDPAPRFAEAARDYADFLPAEERAIVERFAAESMLIAPVEDARALELMRDFLAHAAARRLDIPVPRDVAGFLNGMHERVRIGDLNAFRLEIIGAMKGEAWFRPAYFATARRLLEIIVGNELVMQRNVNLSIQFPHDESSLLALHADTWSGDSPYEIVLWVPYVDCFGTKSMYFGDPSFDTDFQAGMAAHRHKSAERIYAEIAERTRFLDVPYGSILIFTQNVMHGNRVNLENETRWSSNCRFKSALSPYADKKLIEFFEPISLRPATKLGAAYRLPPGF